MQTPTPLSPVSEFLSNPLTWNRSDQLAFVAVVLAAIALIPAVIALGRWILQLRKQKILKSYVDTGAYPLPVMENATRYYVRPRCSNIDPAQEAEIRQVIPTSEDLFQFVDEFLEGEADRLRSGDRTIRHLIVLADSGMGKTSFVLNYYVYNRRRWFGMKRLAIVHLGSANVLEKIAAIENKGETDLILDALDEDIKAVGTPDAYRTRLLDIFQACTPFKHVIVTCRTQFFPRDDEIPMTTGIIDVGPRQAGQGAHYQLWKVYLNPLTDGQVRKYLKKRYPGFILNRKKRNKATETVLKISLLTARPMLLSYIPDLLASNRPIDHTYQLYEVMIEKWLEREKGWVSDTEKLLEFSKEMAVDIYTRKDARGAEKIPRAELLQIAKDKGIDLEDWKLTGRSLLNRDAEGNFKFAHRSIMEYLFIKKFRAGDDRCAAVKTSDHEIHFTPWTDFMKLFLVEQFNFLGNVRKMSKWKSHNFKSDEKIDGADLSQFDFVSYLTRIFKIHKEDIFEIQFTRKEYTNISFSGAILPKTIFHCDLTKSILFSNCTCEGFIFHSKQAKSLYFENADIYDLELNGRFVNVYLDPIKIKYLHAPSADLRGVFGLTEQLLSRGYINEQTQVPPEFEKIKNKRLAKIGSK